MKKVGNDTIRELGPPPNPMEESTNMAGEPANHIGLYQKCLKCPDYGVTCNGPKLAALGDIMVVREFHRAIKVARGITLKDIAKAAPSISEYTVNDYFSHSVKDFKWTTVGVIDNALTAICGNRVGQPLLDNPCPATSYEITAKMEDLRQQIAEERAKNEKLQQDSARNTEEYIQQMALQRKGHNEEREVRERSIAYLRGQAERLQKDVDDEKAQSADYLKRIDEKNATIDEQQKVIAELNKTILDITRENEQERRRANLQKSFIVLLFVITLVALTSYLVWDLVHPGMGFILY